MGETDISTSQVITQQPLLGSVYRSQNVDAWTEDLNQDIKFVMKRAVFVTDTPANIVLTNEDLGYDLLDFNPIQTDSSSNDSADSTLFKNNNKIIRVNHKILDLKILENLMSLSSNQMMLEVELKQGI